MEKDGEGTKDILKYGGVEFRTHASPEDINRFVRDLQPPEWSRR